MKPPSTSAKGCSACEARRQAIKLAAAKILKKLKPKEKK